MAYLTRHGKLFRAQEEYRRHRQTGMIAAAVLDFQTLEL